MGFEPPQLSARKASPPSSKEARVQLWREVESLQQSLETAVKAEKFSEAARLRDEIQSLRLADEYVRTETELQRAVAEERFGEAARLRDVLKLLEPPPGLQEEMEGETWSRTTTEGIEVYVKSYYMPEQSVPEQGRLLFGYKVEIVNGSKETCQLVSRHWRIRQGGGESEVKGPGVVGRQPVLEPGDRFEYTSACPIEGRGGVVGCMGGKYWFCRGETGGVRFEVGVDEFYFKVPEGGV